jgi:hypothetical protein
MAKIKILLRLDKNNKIYIDYEKKLNEIYIDNNLESESNKINNLFQKITKFYETQKLKQKQKK